MSGLKQIFDRFGLRKEGKLFGFGAGPEADWKVIFITAAMLSLAATALNAYLFWQTEKGEIFAVEGQMMEEALPDVEKLKSALEYYGKKADEFERLQNSAAPHPDPSL